MKKLLNKVYVGIEKNLSVNALVAFFLVMAILEFLDKIFFFNDLHLPFPSYIKLLIFIFLFVFTFFKKEWRLFLLSFVLIVFFGFGQFFTNQGFSFDNTFVFLKYVFPLVILKASILFLKDKDSIEPYFHFFEKAIVLNSILLLLGIILSIRIFETYDGERFGYNGIFRAASTGSYAYIITLLYFLLTYKENAVKNWKFILIFISCVFIGTKAVYLAMAFSLGYLIVVSKIPYKKVALSCVAVLGFGAAYYFFFHYDLFNTIRQSDGMLSAILSYRDQLLLEKTLPYIRENWSWVNYLFGGVSDFDLRSQMDLIDVFFFWGIVGGAFYLYLFFKLFLPATLNKTAFVFIAFLFFIVLLSGNFFVYSFVALFLVVLKLKLEETAKNSA